MSGDDYPGEGVGFLIGLVIGVITTAFAFMALMAASKIL